MATHFLIVNADDFGLSAGVNRGIIQAHEHGIVTTASLMVRYDGAEEATAYARGRPDLGLGLHVDLGEWIYRDGEWSALYEVVPAGDPAAMACEVNRQLDRFRSLTGKDPTHIDSHQHVHHDQPARSILQDLAAELRVPLRHYCTVIQYRGDFYGQSAKGEPYPQGISVEGLLATVRSLSPGVTELGCHPGFDDDLNTMYREERATEVRSLCHPSVRAAIETAGIRLCTFAAALDAVGTSSG